jgi:hypothetical protein
VEREDGHSAFPLYVSTYQSWGGEDVQVRAVLCKKFLGNIVHVRYGWNTVFEFLSSGRRKYYWLLIQECKCICWHRCLLGRGSNFQKWLSLLGNLVPLFWQACRDKRVTSIVAQCRILSVRRPMCGSPCELMIPQSFVVVAAVVSLQRWQIKMFWRTTKSNKLLGFDF